MNNTYISFFADGTPKGQPRPRAFARGGKAAVYDPKTAEGWKSQIAMAARAHIPLLPIEGPISITLAFYMPRPKGHYRSGKHSHLLKDSAPRFHLGKPDTDNLAKAVLDALTTLRFWPDDSQIVHLDIAKFWVDKKDPSGCSITLKNARIYNT